jgi:GNAT superfamily N-acetyltransferase
MALAWTHESPPYWNADKARVLATAPAGALAFKPPAEGALLPGDWFRVEEDGKAVGYGWMDTTWGDAEILLCVDASRRTKGVGTYIVDQLAREAAARGLNYVYNRIPVTHPTPDLLRAWLAARGFAPGEDRGLLRRPARP